MEITTTATKELPINQAQWNNIDYLSFALNSNLMIILILFFTKINCISI